MEGSSVCVCVCVRERERERNWKKAEYGNAMPSFGVKN